MGTSLVTVVVTLALTVQVDQPRSPGAIRQQELDYQSQAFEQWWGSEYVRNFEELPTEGEVPDFRVPYCGHDYPDRGGGTMHALRKYDMAFHNGRRVASEYERQDVGAHRGALPGERPRLLGNLFAELRRRRAPQWYGHCNGWTAAAIRHAEPQRNVVRNGVVFTPADIKGLLAEIYMYSDTEFLGGVDSVINAGTLHLTLTNWLGRGAHPVGVETAVGEVVINYPIFEYSCKTTPRGERQVEVFTTVKYAMNTNREFERGPDVHRTMSFHYLLELNEQGEIEGGRYYNDSQRVDMLWAPLKPVQGGEPGNERGNPHVDVREVLAIWRESVPEDIRTKWLNIDPTDEDRVVADPAPEAPSTPATPAAPAAETAARETRE